MSIRPLLDEDTKDQAWSDLFCHSINAKIINGDEIQGGARVTVNPVTNLSFTPLAPSAGIVSPTMSSIIWRWEKTMVDELKARQLNASISIISMTKVGSVSPIGTVWECDLLIPFGESISYPGANGTKVPGGGSGTVTDSVTVGGPYLIPCTVLAIRKSATVITLQVTCQVTFDAPGRSAILDIAMNYMVA